MRKNHLFISIVLIYSCLATVLGILYCWTGNFTGPALAFLPLGIFIWQDAVILGGFVFLAAALLAVKDNYIWTGLFFSTYAIIRCFIETLYWLNAQFSVAYRPWEQYWIDFSNYYGISIMNIYVTGQLIFTCLTIISILVFIHFFKKYLNHA